MSNSSFKPGPLCDPRTTNLLQHAGRRRQLKVSLYTHFPILFAAIKNSNQYLQATIKSYKKKYLTQITLEFKRLYVKVF